MNEAAARKATVVRFFIVHLVAYVPAVAWGIAAVPWVFLRDEDAILALPDEHAAVAWVLKRAALPIVVAFVLPHLVGIPWIRSAKAGTSAGRALFWVGTALLTLAGAVLGALAWIRVLAILG